MQQVGRLVQTVVLALLVVTCDSGNGPSGVDYTDTGALSAGYTGTGFNSFGQALDPQFVFLYFNEALPEGPWDCFTDGYCGLGGLTDQFGNVASVPDSFLFVSTANLTDAGSGNEVVVVSSGIATKSLSIPGGTQYDSLRAVFEWAMLTSRLQPATHNDSIVVRVKSGTDSATVFKVTSADLQGGHPVEKPGGCGSRAVSTDRPLVTYAHCSDWATATVDLTPYRGRSFVLEFIVSEGGQELTDTVDEPTALLVRNLKVEGGT